MEKSITNIFEKEKWECCFDPENNSVMSFKHLNNDCFYCEGVDIGPLKEYHGISNYLRIHSSEKISQYTVDSEVVQPFGSEPVIRRKVEQFSNRMRITTDISLKTSMDITALKIDTLKILGEWEKLVIYHQKSRESFDILKEEFDIENLDGDGISFDYIPLIVVFINKDGFSLEIGTGSDLWRWNNASRFSATGKFSLKKEKKLILFERIPFLWEGEYEIEKFNFRFSWYFSWGTKKKKESLSKEKRESLYFLKNQLTGYQKNIKDYFLDTSNWPPNALSSSSKEPCFASRQTENLFRNFLRKIFFELDNTDICIHGINPHICSNSSHLNRGKISALMHWDYCEMMILQEWANKFLSEKKIGFSFKLNPESIFYGLPSIFRRC